MTTATGKPPHTAQDAGQRSEPGMPPDPIKEAASGCSTTGRKTKKVAQQTSCRMSECRLIKV
jgi:hypothetical protein